MVLVLENTSDKSQYSQVLHSWNPDTMLLEHQGYVFIYSSKINQQAKMQSPASTASDWKMCVNLHQTHPASDQTDLGCVQTSLYGPTSTAMS